MSNEPASQTSSGQENYPFQEIELYYHFWVISDDTSWYHTAQEERKEHSLGYYRRKLFSPFSIVLLSSCFFLSLVGFISWQHQVKSPNDYYEKINRSQVLIESTKNPDHS